MTKLAEITQKMRSKNAGPFWITIDIFCSDDAEFKRAIIATDSEHVAHALGISMADLKRYDMPDLRVVKFSFPRPIIQGTRFDRAILPGRTSGFAPRGNLVASIAIIG